jgi:hypothetical protein
MANATMRSNLELAEPARPAATARATRPRASGQGAGGWDGNSRRFVRNNPVAVLIGAFVLGVALAKLARHA